MRLLVVIQIPLLDRPAEVLGSLHHFCAERITFDVWTNGEKVFVLLNGKALEPALLNMPFA